MLWYPTAMMDTVYLWLPIVIALGIVMSSIQIAKTRAWIAICMLSSIFGGWIMLNAQKQRQDRYVIPAYPIMSADSQAPSLVTIAAIPFTWKVTENINIFNSNAPAPAQRDYLMMYVTSQNLSHSPRCSLTNLT